MTVETIYVPDLGGADSVEVIELLVSLGDVIAVDDSLATVESDKASMEIPATQAGKIVAIHIALDDTVSEGDKLIDLEVDVSTKAGAKPESQLDSKPAVSQESPEKTVQKLAPVCSAAPTKTVSSGSVYAGPAVRKLARVLGVDLHQVGATGPRGRLQKEDLHHYIRTQLEKAQQGGSGIPQIPEVDFTKFGEIELEPMSKIARLIAANMQRSWLNVPHVTHFDEANLVELEALRKGMKPEAEKKSIKLTPLAFLLKATAEVLKSHPKINSSLHADGKHFVRKQYIHLGMAVDTPAGLVVPVIKDADKKTIWQLAEEVISLSGKAREGKLKPAEMQGACFTLSSLGAIGGMGFTPIVNAPEVAILGISKTQIKPEWNGSNFEPVSKLPLCLSYDHRAVNGADAGRFMTDLVVEIENIKV